MSTLEFIKNPKKDDIISSFPNSPYFSEEAFGNRENGISLGTDLLAASIESRVVGTLAWSLSCHADINILKIELIEVIPEYRGRRIGPSLIQEAELINAGKFDTVQGFLNSPFNIPSSLMFLRCGFRRIGAYFFTKNID